MCNYFIRFLWAFSGLVLVSGCTTLSLDTVFTESELMRPAIQPAPIVNKDVSDRFDRVNAALTAKNYPVAENLLTSFIEDYPDFSSPYTNLGIVYLETERQGLALQSFERAVELRPSACEALVQIGLIQRKRREFKLAEKAYMACIFVDPNYAPAFVNLGVLLEIYVGRLPEALSAYERYQSLEPNKRVAIWILDLSRRVESEKQLASGGMMR